MNFLRNLFGSIFRVKIMTDRDIILTLLQPDSYRGSAWIDVPEVEKQAMKFGISRRKVSEIIDWTVKTGLALSRVECDCQGFRTRACRLV